MPLDPNDPTPIGISFSDAYSKVREWYQSNGAKAAGLGPNNDEYARRSEALIRALPSPSATSDLEKRVVLQEIICGLLEWGYNASDGHYKMAAYAYSASHAAGLPWYLSKDESDQLRESPLWPLLSCSLQYRSTSV